MKNLIRTTLLAGMLLASVAVFGGGQVSLGIRIGAPPAPRVVRMAPSPGPGYVQVQGYWYPVGGKYRWHAGYWTRPPYEGARWVGPHHDGTQFFAGYWDGDKGRMEHDHATDRGRGRDYRP